MCFERICVCLPRGVRTCAWHACAALVRGHLFAQVIHFFPLGCTAPTHRASASTAEAWEGLESPTGSAVSWGPFNTAPTGTQSLQSPCTTRAECSNAVVAAGISESQLPRGVRRQSKRSAARREVHGTAGQGGRRQWMPQATNVAAEAAKEQYVQLFKNCGVAPRCSNNPMSEVPTAH